MSTKKWYFNKGVCLKDLGRFWPIWGAYLLIWLAILPLNLNSELSAAFQRGAAMPEAAALQTICGVCGKGALLMTFFFSAFVAMAVFGYLYNSSSVAYFHSLPIRREGLFLSAWVSGLIMLLGSNVIVFAATVAVAAAWGVPCGAAALWWLAGTSALSLFFFSFACFCAQFTGHIVALPVFYGILTVLASAVYAIISSIVNEVVYGLMGGSGLIYRIVAAMSPPWFIWSGGYGPAVIYATDSGPGLEVYGRWYMLGLAVAGLVFALLAVLVYRRRKSETAGDVVSVRAVRPVFKYGVAFCAALCTGLAISYAACHDFSAGIFGVSMAAGGFVFYFVADMILKKSFKVFKGRNFIGWGAFTVVMVALLAVAVGTGFGVENRVPPVSRVESVHINTYSYNGALPGGQTDSWTDGITEPADIELVRQLHKLALSEKDISQSAESGAVGESVLNWEVYDSANLTVIVNYNLKNGAVLSRVYDIYVTPERLADPSTAAGALQSIMDRPDLAGSPVPAQAPEGWDLSYAQINFSGYEGEYMAVTGAPDAQYSAEGIVLTGMSAQALLDAVNADAAKGDIGQACLLPDEKYYEENYLVCIEFAFEREEIKPGEPSELSTYEVTLSTAAENTIEVIKRSGALEHNVLITLPQLAEALGN